MNKTLKLPVTRFSTAQLPGPDRWDAWRDSISVLFDVSPRAPSAVADEEHSVLGAHLGAVLFGETRFVAQSFERSQRTIIGNGLDHYLVQCYTEGGYAGQAGDEDVLLRPGDICILDLAQTLRTQNPRSHLYSLVIPRDVLDAALGRARPRHGEMLRRESGAAQLLKEHLRTLGQCLTGMAASEAPMLSEATVGMVAACFRPTAEARARAEAPLASATLSRIKRHIEARLDAPDLSPASLAAAFRVSRTTLYRMFEPLGGVNAFIQARRLARAQLALLLPANKDRQIHEIAFDCGFASEAHFSRRFRAAYGVTPTAWRREATVPAHGDLTLEEYNYARWIAQLRAD
jgi:AraC-like DNA-binding protein